MNPSLNQLNVHNVSLTYENWLGLLKKPLPERPNFQLENGVIHIGQVIGNISWNSIGYG